MINILLNLSHPKWMETVMLIFLVTFMLITILVCIACLLLTKKNKD
jgi:hypothetical protein